MNVFFTSDLHFGSSNINKYCDRPYKSALDAERKLINNINSRCKEGDVLYHVGDFILYGKERGIENMRRKPEYYEDQINCDIIHIIGNHDRNNGLKSGLLGCYIQLSKNLKAWVQHYPPWEKSVYGPVPNADVYLCCHVHEKWRVKFFNTKPVINVGCDQWKYYPVKKSELIQFVEKIKGEMTI